MHTGRGQHQLVEEINITPLTDVFLVLLIIMMVVAPMLNLARGDIEQPKVEGGAAISKIELVLEIASDSKMYINGDEVVEERLQDVLKMKSLGATKKTLVLRADKNAKSKLVLAVLDAAQNDGFESVAFGVDSAMGPLTTASSPRVQIPSSTPTTAPSQPAAATATGAPAP